jgi:hypothetical protein
MADQVGVRAQTDTESMRGLLVANGGGAVALLAALTAILDRDGYEPLAKAMLIGLFVMMLGVVLAVVHNHFRRLCSLEYQVHNMNPPNGTIFGMQLWAPTVCCVSIVCMWLSVATFLAAGSYVAISGIANVSSIQSQKAAGRPTGVTEQKGAKSKTK